MNSVRETAKTTVTLIILAVGLALFIRWYETLPGEFFYKMKSLLNSKRQIGGFHSFLITLSFWLLLIESGIEVVYFEKSGVYALGSFGTPIIFSLCVGVWGLVAKSARVNILWFWLFYYVGLIICVRISYNRLTNYKGFGLSDTKQLFRNPLFKKHRRNRHISIIDRKVIYIAKIIVLADWFALLISTIVFCIQYKQIFGL